MTTVRTLLALLASALLLHAAPASADKPEKIPVAVGKWNGPSASTFKGGLRRGLKDVKVVGAKSARVIVDGEVTPDGKGFAVKVIVKAAKSGEVVEQREFKFSSAKVSQGQSSRMGKAVAEIAQRAPSE